MVTDISGWTHFGTGTMLGLAAAILFGVHTSFSKVKANIAMTIYKVYFLFGTAITCFIETIIITAMGESIHFTYLGIISALLLLGLEIFLLLSIQKIGVRHATGWAVFAACFTAPIAQYTLEQSVAYWYIMVAGLITLSLSVFLISLLPSLLQCFGCVKPPKEAIDSEEPSIEYNFLYGHGQSGTELPLLTVILSGTKLKTDSMETEELPLFVPRASARRIKKRNKYCDIFLGLLFSFLSGICMDLLPYPYLLNLGAHSHTSGEQFFLSFGIGCIIVMPLSALMIIFDHNLNYTRWHSLRQVLKLHNKIWHFKNVKGVGIPAITAGMIWSLGNICSFMSFEYLEYTTAVAYIQCQVIVALICRVIMHQHREDIEKAALIFLCLLYMGGCVVVIYGVHGMFPDFFNSDK